LEPKRINVGRDIEDPKVTSPVTESMPANVRRPATSNVLPKRATARSEKDDPIVVKSKIDREDPRRA
jgi:hypothetical protein